MHRRLCPNADVSHYALFLSAGTLLFVFAIEEIAQEGWFSGSTAVRLAGAMVLVGVFFFIENRVVNPVVPLNLFKLPNVCAAAFAGLFQATAYAALFVMYPCTSKRHALA